MVILIRESADGISQVECPICHRNFKVITMTHLKGHGYKNKEDFLNDYPGTQLVSKEYEESNRELRRDVLTKVNKSPEQRAKASAHAKELNKDSERQSAKGLKGWTDERRQQKSDLIRSINYRINNDPEYADYRERRLKGFSYGKKIPYNTQDGRHLVLRSFLECRVCKFLELNNFNFEYETIAIPYKADGKTYRYYPDFYLKDYNLLIEVKPEEAQDDIYVVMKKEASENEGYNFLFVSDSDLVHYNKLINKITALGAK